MNAKQLIAVAALALAAGQTFAADYTAFPVQQGSQTTRAAVAAEARQAVAADEVTVGDDAVVSLAARSEQPRAAVRAETAAANRAGRLPVGELLSFDQRVASIRG
jgi:hypothetical protein